MKDEKILVTGGCGYIGIHICSALLKKGYQVVATDRSGDIYNEKKEGYTFKQLIGTDKTKFAELFKEHTFSGVIHTASSADNDIEGAITKYEIDTSHLWDSYIFRFAALAGVKHMLMLSTTQVYKPAVSREPLREDDDVKPVTNYGKLKHKSEDACVSAFQKASSTATAIMRIPPIYSRDYCENLKSKITDPKDNSNFIYRSGDYGFAMCNLYNLMDFIVCYLKIADSINFSGVYNIADRGLVQASDIVKFCQANSSLGPVVQRSEIADTAKSFLNMKLGKDKDLLENYRFLDVKTLLANHGYEVSKAGKICPLKWNIDNSK
jgi:UDP-glucose 4-epimerase